jgi:hypothetical protein
MRLALLVALAFSLFASPSLAQPAPEAMVLHPGDKIVFQPGRGHKVIFGGDMFVDPNTTVTLASFDVVAGLLQFLPCEPGTASCEVLLDNGFVATVRSDIDFSTAVTSFDLSCAIHNEMVVLPFTVAPPASPAAPPRTLLVTATNSLQWLLDGQVINRF